MAPAEGQSAGGIGTLLTKIRGTADILLSELEAAQEQLNDQLTQVATARR